MAKNTTGKKSNVEEEDDEEIFLEEETASDSDGVEEDDEFDETGDNADLAYDEEEDDDELGDDAEGDSSDYSRDEDDEDDDEEVHEENKGHGDVFAKIMGKEITNEAVPILVAKPSVLAAKSNKNRAKANQLRQAKLLKKLYFDKNHVRPEYDANERRLIRIGTKGVVTLFNAVSKHQKTIAAVIGEKAANAKDKSKGKRSDLKKGDMLATKEGFLSLLSSANKPAALDETDGKKRRIKKKDRAEDGSSSTKRAKTDNTADEKQGKGWNILSDNYLLGGKLR